MVSYLSSESSEDATYLFQDIFHFWCFLIFLLIHYSFTFMSPLQEVGTPIYVCIKIWNFPFTGDNHNLQRD